MKVYVENLNGCVWCPNHEDGYASDLPGHERCRAIRVRKNNYKLIRRNEMYNEEHPENPYYKFPQWCPLKDKC